MKSQILRRIYEIGLPHGSSRQNQSLIIKPGHQHIDALADATHHILFCKMVESHQIESYERI